MISAVRSLNHNREAYDVFVEKRTKICVRFIKKRSYRYPSDRLCKTSSTGGLAVAFGILMRGIQPRLSRCAIAQTFLPIHPLRSIDFRDVLSNSWLCQATSFVHVINPFNLRAEWRSRSSLEKRLESELMISI